MVSSITGGTVNVNVDGHTQVTDSLEIAGLTNRSYSSNYTYQNESSQSLDKTLATIEEGSLTVGGEETSPEGLNRDIDEVNKDSYAVDREQDNIDLTVDHRLLSEDGRKEIGRTGIEK